ncbi:MAG: response regulator [Thaumarchaeota archaeon]|nr:response regulator [Nitrososphaerota archaeon]
MKIDGQLQTNRAHSSMNAIVIDDDVDVRDLFIELLKMNEINILGIGSNGKDALELYKLHNPDIVFIDYIMPQYDGLYGAEKIKEFDPHAKIVLVSGSYIEKGRLDNLVSVILKKPIEINDVISTINKMVCSINIK